MAELTEEQIISKIATIDDQINNIISVLGTAGQGSVQFLNYEIGSKRVDGADRLKMLQEARKMYQGLLNSVPKSITRDHGDCVSPLTGTDHTQMLGDE